MNERGRVLEDINELSAACDRAEQELQLGWVQILSQETALTEVVGKYRGKAAPTLVQIQPAVFQPTDTPVPVLGHVRIQSLPSAPIPVAPAPVSAAPTPVSAAPTPTSAAPAPVTAAPAPVSAAPTPTSAAPTPTSSAPTPVSAAPAPVSAAPTPVSAAPTPVTAAPAPVSAAPAPISSAPAPISAAPAPVSEAPAPVSDAPASVSAAPAPISEAPAPVSAAPAPTSAAPAPVTAAPTPTSADPTPISADPAPVSAAPAQISSAPAPVSPVPTPMSAAPAPVSAAPAPITAAPAPVSAAPAPISAAPALISAAPAPISSAPAQISSAPAPIPAEPASSNDATGGTAHHHGNQRQGKDLAQKVIFGEGGSATKRFWYPVGVTVSDEGEIFVADWGNKRIQVFTLQGAFVRQFPTVVAGGQKMDLYDVAMDGVGSVWGVGNLLVGGTYSAEFVVQYSKEGRMLRMFDLQAAVGYRGVAVDTRRNHILITQIIKCRPFDLRGEVLVFRPDGTFVRTVRTVGRQPRMKLPRFLTVGSEGNILVSDCDNHRVYVYKEDGEFLFRFGGKGSGDGQLNHPHGICTDRAGNIIVADWGNRRVEMFDKTGKFLKHIVKNMRWPHGVAIATQGQLVVNNVKNQTVSIFHNSCCEVLQQQTTLTGGFLPSTPVSAAPAPISAAPAPISTAPASVSAAPASVSAAPPSVSAAPPSVSAAPALISAAPALIPAAPAPTAAAPAPTSAAPAPISAAPAPITAAPAPILAAPVTIPVEPAPISGASAPISAAPASSNDATGGTAHHHGNQRQGEDQPQKVTFGEGGSGTGQFWYPVGVTVSDEGEIFVADWGNKRIQVFTLQGEFVRQFPTVVAGGQKMDPHDVAMDGVGSLWVGGNLWVGGTDSAEFAVQYSKEGRMLRMFDLQAAVGYRGVAVDTRRNHILITQITECGPFHLHGEVLVFRPDGALVRTVGQQQGMKHPRYITVDEEGNILVSDCENHCVYVYNEDGEFLFQFGGEGSGEGQLKGPRGIGTDKAGNIFVADKGRNWLCVILKKRSHRNCSLVGGLTSQGQKDNKMATALLLLSLLLLSSLGTQSEEPTLGGKRLVRQILRGVTVSDEGEIFVADQMNKRIQVFTLQGTFVRQFPTVVSGGQKMNPHDVAMDGEGNLWVVGKTGRDSADFAVQYNKQGTVLRKFDLPKVGVGIGVAVDTRTNHILIAQTTRIGDPMDRNFHGEVLVYRPDGTHVKTVGQQQGMKDPQYITVDGEGRILVSDSDNHCVYVYNEDGQFLFKFGGAGSGEGQLMNPCGICTDRAGNIIVADWGNRRVEMFDKTGKFLKHIATDMKGPKAVAMAPQGQLVVIDHDIDTRTSTVSIFPTD
ncbi:uncharacterized protein LOC144865162 [Branchiostoma floridae x Branchiostoma japonicum]